MNVVNNKKAHLMRRRSNENGGEGRELLVTAYTKIRKSAEDLILREAKKQNRSYAGQLRHILHTYEEDLTPGTPLKL